MPLGPALPTAFELQVRQLRLTPDAYSSPGPRNSTSRGPRFCL